MVLLSGYRYITSGFGDVPLATGCKCPHLTGVCGGEWTV